MSGRRDKGGGGGGHGGGEERWLLPYADMITLLLGLFIVLFAMSTLDAKKFENVKRSLSQVFNGQVTTESGDVLDGSESVLDPNSTSEPPSQAQIQQAQATMAASRQQFQKQAEKLRQVAQEAGLKPRDVKIIENQQGIVIRLAGDALFDSGSAELKPGVKDKLARIERQLLAFEREIEIVGHTDGVPFPYPGGNWGLGADRAQAVLMYFLELDYPGSKMRFTSEGDTNPVKAPPKDNPRADMPENRRIEILVLAPGAKVPGSEAEKVAAVAETIDGADAGFSNPAEVDLYGQLAQDAQELQS